jgi:catechol 2,3-dioxygenase-like lactoylglutathione lyase family enzyme
MKEGAALINACPTLASLDIMESVRFYEEKMGFRRTFADEGYAVLVRDRIAIHFWKCDNPIFPQNTSCYLDVTGIEELYEECKAQGIIHPNGALEDKPWGQREFAILDLHGNLIRLGMPIAS